MTPPTTANAADRAPARETMPAAAKPAAEQADPVERHLRAEGYVMQMREGERLFCKREEALGSRLMSHYSCATKEALMAREEHDQAEAAAAQARARTGCPNPCH